MTADRNRNRAFAYVVGVFAVGFAAGALAMNLYLASAESADPGRTSGRHESKKALLEKLTEELRLAPEQAEQIDLILSETREEYMRLRKETQPRYQDIRGRSRDRIRAVLGPDQLSRFEEMVRQRDEERKKQFEKDSR
ncbi:MAG: hypothetical protein HY650_05995 [Acidobacteria bacterium]|nr:hypothetical protein [Acidobacteriota bacterium]